MKLMVKGAASRTTGQTKLNSESSRSHCVFVMRVECRTTLASGVAQVQYGSIHLVDLAGSERIKLTGTEGQARVEASQINTSLSHLGIVISNVRARGLSISSFFCYMHVVLCSIKMQSPVVPLGLRLCIQYAFFHIVLLHWYKEAFGVALGVCSNSTLLWGHRTKGRSMGAIDGAHGMGVQVVEAQESGKARHIPYRNSKLTFLLQDSLGGNSKTFLVANVSPSNLCAHETLSTLQFADRAKCIRNRAKVNTDTEGTEAALQSEVERLREELRKVMQVLLWPSFQLALQELQLPRCVYMLPACMSVETCLGDYQGALIPGHVAGWHRTRTPDTLQPRKTCTVGTVV